MPLQFQVIDVKFTQGLDTRTQRKLVMPGKWDDLLNYSLSTDNTPRKRDGYAALVGSANGNGLAQYNAELLTVSGGVLSSVSTTASLAVTKSGTLGYVQVSKEEVQRSTGMQDTPDCATGGGFTCYVWREKSAANATVGINCTLIDESNGSKLVSNQSLRANAAVFSPRVVFCFDTFFIFYIQGTSLFCRTILVSSPTVVNGEFALIVSASLADINFDACAANISLGNASAMVSYGWADGVTSVATIQVIQAGGVPLIFGGPTNLFTEAQLPVATITGICCAAFSDGSHFATFVTSTGAAAMAGLAGRTIDTTWTPTTAAMHLDAAVAATSSPVHVTAVINDALSSVCLQVFWDRESEWATNALNPVRSALVTTAMGLAAGPTTVFNSATFGAGARGPQGPFIAGKSFTNGSRVFLPVFVGSVYNSLSSASSNPRTANTQNTIFVFDCNAAGSSFSALGTPVAVARALYGSYGLASINGTAPSVATPCSVIQPTSGTFSLLCGELTLLVLSAGNNISPTGLVRLNMTPTVAHALGRLQLGESTYFAGGALSAYDGAQVVEQGFMLFPEGISITVNGAVSGNMSAGVHQVVFIYEWVDNAGQRYQSAPSLPISVTTVATGSLTCAVPTLLITQKAATIRVVAFMTQVGGTTFFRTGIATTVLNSTAATTVSLTVLDSDTTISGNEVLYTQPGTAPTMLPNLSPGPCTAIWTAQNRLFFDKSDKPGWFGYSQPYVNNVGLQFSPDLEAALPVESGGFVAGAAMDEKVVIFGRRRIYVMYGTGPSTAGTFNNYSQPQDIQADVGCSDALSILSEFPGGIIFKSKKGFYVLQRDLSVKYIGEGVARFDANTVTAAVLLEDRQECRFVTSGSAGGWTGTTLVYSYLTDQWSYFVATNHDYLPLDAMWWPAGRNGTGSYVHITLADGLNQDVPGSIIDQPGLQAAASVQSLARTGWLKLGALEGFQRVRWLYLSATAPLAPTGLLEILVDYDDVYGGPNMETIVVDLSTITFADPSCIDLRHKIIKQQKCKSIAFTFADVPTGSQQGLNGIQAIALEIGLKKGVNRLPAGQTV